MGSARAMIRKAARDIGLLPRFPFRKLASGESQPSPEPDEHESEEESDESEEHASLELSLSPPTVSPPHPPSSLAVVSLVSDEQESELVSLPTSDA